MIKVSFSKNGFTISGHSGYEDAGKDIVCAAVSSCANMFLCGTEDVLEIGCNIETDASIPFLKVEIPTGISDEKRKTAQVLLESFKFQVKSMEEDFSEYLKVF